jgi:hypothetical protein
MDLMPSRFEYSSPLASAVRMAKVPLIDPVIANAEKYMKGK